MSKELDIAIEGLYKTFSRYPFNSEIEGCSCCVSRSDKKKLLSKPLRELQEDDISRYSLKAMTTWGDTTDFKHYLPRIFELVSTTDFIVDTFVILGKLEYGKWQNWPQDEIDSIKIFLIAWWKNEIQCNTFFDREVFTEIYKAIGNIRTLLDAWDINFENNSLTNFIDFVSTDFYPLIYQEGKFKILPEREVKQIVNWIYTKKSLLEDAFFFHEDKDSELAESISTTLDIIENHEKKYNKKAAANNGEHAGPL